MYTTMALLFTLLNRFTDFFIDFFFFDIRGKFLPRAAPENFPAGPGPLTLTFNFSRSAIPYHGTHISFTRTPSGTIKHSALPRCAAARGFKRTPDCAATVRAVCWYGLVCEARGVSGILR